jgi:hypothetical protein
MRKSRLTLLPLVLLVVALLAGTPASACEYCAFKILCVVDECWLVESCASGNSRHPGQDDCAVYFPGYCQTSGEFCRWAGNEHSVAPLPQAPSSFQGFISLLRVGP